MNAGCLNNCSGKGTCDDYSGVCSCEHGYSGEDCSVVCITDDISYLGDNYCDDQLNKVECSYDNGDCCNKIGNDWDQYCTVSLGLKIYYQLLVPALNQLLPYKIQSRRYA